jgi:predicted AlkP superfamily pyrophosphatase or phosphodiesterase
MPKAETLPRRRVIAFSRIAAIALALLAACFQTAAQTPPRNPAAIPVVVTPHGDNAPAQREKPYIILVSLDGFRFDYAERYGAKSLLDMAAHGASAPQGMIPSYPSVTFPNHISIATGLYPEHHGIVENTFYDPRRKQKFVYVDRSTSNDGAWYGGVPLWVLAERQGMRTASFFWPGSEAEIGGVRPTYNVAFDQGIPGARRIEQVVEWLRLPPETRPHFITMYFGEADSAGHRTGTDSRETIEAVRQIDGMIARLNAAVASLRLPVNIVVVSDHGMVNTEGPWIDLEKLADLSGFQTAGSLLYAPSEAAAARVYSQLRGASDKFAVYRRAEMPAHLHYNDNERIGDPVVVPTGPYLIRARASGNPNEIPPKGMHGYDPQSMETMRAVFYAAGPNIRPGVKLPPFENVNIYPLLANILGLQIGPIDGDLRVLQPVLLLNTAAPKLPALRRPGGLVPSRPQR